MFNSKRFHSLARTAAISALLSISFTAAAHDACERRLTRNLDDGRFFIDRSTLAGAIANHQYTVSPRALTNFQQTRGGPSFEDVMNSEVLGGAINNEKEALGLFFGADAARYAGLWFIVGRFNPDQRIREHYAVNIAINRETQALVILDVRPAVQRSVQVYSAALSSIGRDLPTNEQTRYKIRPLLGCSNLEVPGHIVEKLEGRHDIKIADVIQALSSQRRTNPMPYLDRGLVVPGQYTLLGFTAEGRKVRIGLIKEFKDGAPLWRLLTAFYKD